MPRLIGKTSKTPLYAIATCLVLAGAVTTSEYLGAIDLVPGFGRDNPEMRSTELPSFGSSEVMS
ncbi:hypothetical protein [Chamaesiphon sp. VAR_69_metabat_338]|uniref:hypothetical protein n=1 Tax=Chamaesiphon sp. VAR_69_metabat_338 TaxID=2964704 RepID=UPI00286DA77F|nr:hypothetical protein [Chamaesiphon sp. VAR_69_metabat_338]